MLMERKAEKRPLKPRAQTPKPGESPRETASKARSCIQKHQQKPSELWDLTNLTYQKISFSTSQTRALQPKPASVHYCGAARFYHSTVVVEFLHDDPDRSIIMASPKPRKLTYLMGSPNKALMRKPRSNLEVKAESFAWRFSPVFI